MKNGSVICITTFEAKVGIAVKNMLVQLRHMFRILKHPFTGFEEIRFKGMGSLGSAMVIVFLVCLARTLSMGLTNFIFNKYGLERASPGTILIQTAVPFIIWVVANYLVCTISKGQGRFIDVFIGTAYALSPYVIFSVPLAIISNIFTAQEQSIYYFLNNGIYCWCIFLIFVEVMVVEGYEVGETFANIAWTIFTVGMMIVICLAVSGIVVQNYSYIFNIVMEVIDLA